MPVQYVLLFLTLVINPTQSQILELHVLTLATPLVALGSEYIHVQTGSEASMWDVLITTLIVPY